MPPGQRVQRCPPRRRSPTRSAAAANANDPPAAGLAHPHRARRRPTGQRGTRQQRHRHTAFRLTAHRANPPHPRLHQTRTHLPRTARPGSGTPRLIVLRALIQQRIRLGDRRQRPTPLPSRTAKSRYQSQLGVADLDVAHPRSVGPHADCVTSPTGPGRPTRAPRRIATDRSRRDSAAPTSRETKSQRPTSTPPRGRVDSVLTGGASTRPVIATSFGRADNVRRKEVVGMHIYLCVSRAAPLPLSFPQLLRPTFLRTPRRRR
jgi:hypothetical protein